ncbi:MAG TPA: hypothetical protein VHU14_01500 [Solirubrobacterales bacterium]|nr:hypothetical protein [Solirubrobacterales bacterium]
MSRLRILTLFIAPIALATAFAACGSSSSDSPQAIVDEATLQGIESGKIDLSVGNGVKGEKSGHIDVNLSGPFQSESEAELPELDLTASAKGSVGGENIDFDGGFTLLHGNKAYVGYKGTEYEVDPTTFSYVQSLAKKQGTGGEKSSEITACQEAAGELKIADFIENLSEGGSVDVGGTSTTKVSGDLDASGALDAAGELIENPACSEQLEAAGSVPSAAELDAAKGTVKDAVKNAHIDLYVGDDHIVRRMVVDATIEPPEGAGSNGVKRVDLEFDLTLTGVNEDQTISAPPSSKPLSDLFLKLGVNPIELLGAVQGGAGGIGGLLEGIVGGGGASSNGGSGGSRSGSSGGSSGGGQQAYYECLSEAHTPVDIQNCTGKLQ